MALAWSSLVRLELAKAALEAKTQPTDLSFIRALHYIQIELSFAALMQAPGNIPENSAASVNSSNRPSKKKGGGDIAPAS